MFEENNNQHTMWKESILQHQKLHQINLMAKLNDNIYSQGFLVCEQYCHLLVNDTFYYISKNFMQNEKEIDFEWHSIPNSYLMIEAQSPLYPRFDLHQYNLQLDPNDLNNLEQIEQILTPQTNDQLNQNIEINQTSKNTRSEWSRQQQIQFFEFLALYHTKNPNQFKKWNKPNKKGLFKQMALRLVSKTPIQCRLKFFSFKRKHSHRKNKSSYSSCMRNLIIQKLKQFSGPENQFNKLLSSLQEIKYRQRYQVDNTDFLCQSKVNRSLTTSNYQKFASSKRRINCEKKNQLPIQKVQLDQEVEKMINFKEENSISLSDKDNVTFRSV